MHKQNDSNLKKKNLKKKLICLSLLFVFPSCTKVSTGTWTGNGPVTCGGQNCVAVGVYNLNSISNGGLPLSVFSTDGGQTFTTSSQFSLLNEMANPATTTELYGVSCVGQNCVGSGTYNLEILGPGPMLVGTALPLSVMSHDGGKTFFANISQPQLPIGANTKYLSQLDGITCRGQTCVAVGVYNLNLNGGVHPEGGVPLATISFDGGVTFATATQPALPIGADTVTQNSFLYAVSCPSDTRCVAVGNYNQNYFAMPQTTNLPYAVISNDGGKNFTKASAPVLPADALPNQYATLKAVTCKNNRCVAVGLYNRVTATGSASPFVAISNDGGETFTKAYKPNLPIDGDNTLAAQLTGISCVDKRCVAVGNYNVSFSLGDPATGFPLVLISNDSGESFSIAYQPAIPSTGATTNALLTGVSCTDERCVAVGGYNLSYFDTNLDGGIPITLISHNRGNTFTPVPPVILPSNADLSKGAIFGTQNQF